MASGQEKSSQVKETCATCKFHDVDGLYKFYGQNANGMGDIGFCRRYPPKPGDWRMKDEEIDMGRTDVFLFCDWPETMEDDWCGEHKPLTTNH